MNQKRSIGRMHVRRARLYLTGAMLGFAVVAAGWYLLRPAPEPYTPGAEASRGEEITSNLSRSLPADAPALRFTDVAESAGILFDHFQGRRSTQLPEDMGSGLAWGDYDGDGDPDLYIVNESGPLDSTGRSEGTARAALYRNDGDGSFTDVTDAAGVGADGCGMGAAWGDYDGDGDLDLAVTRVGAVILYRNDGDGTFTDVSARTRAGSEEGFWTGASWSDYDLDGDVDLYIAGYVQYRFDDAVAGKTSYQYGALLPFTLNPSSYTPERNLLLRNDGGVFTDVAGRAGVDNPQGRSLSASWCDFDADGWPDLYVANDISDNAMYRNQHDGTFMDVSHSAWVADYRGAMGLGVGDWENDGDFDIFVTHWIAQENALYENQSEKMPPTELEPMHFIDQSDLLGLGQIALDYIGWGTGFDDFDNDGRLDLFVANGSTFPDSEDPSLLVPMKNLLFWNAGPERGFFEIGQASGESFQVSDVARGSAAADYDGDGDLDVALLVNGGRARLLRNDGGNAGSWLRLVLRGAGDRSTRFALGARIALTSGGRTQVRQIGCGSSYLSQSPPGEAHFGLGDATRIDRLEIRWPDGDTQTFEDLPVSTAITIVQGGQPAVAQAGVRPADSRAAR